MLIINFDSPVIKIISNYLSKIWNLLSVFIFVPLYIHYLGIENYAVIGFYSLVLGLISFADAGMSSAITREFALDEKSSYKFNVLKKIERIYWLVITILCFTIALFSDLISKKFLETNNIALSDLKNFVILIGIGTSLQLISSLYFGALFGLGKQIQANNLQMIWTTARSLFVVILLAFIQPSLYIFLIWQIFCNVIYIIRLRNSVIVIIKPDKGEFQSVYKMTSLPPRILKYIGGMSLVAIISAINSQADKLVISSYFPLKVFGYYSMVSVLAQIPTLVAIPMASFIFPMLSKYADKGSDSQNFDKVFIRFVSLLYLLVIPVTLMVCFYPTELFVLWANKSIDESILPSLPLLINCLLIGSLFLAMQFPYYYVLLSKYQTKYTVYQGFLQVMIGIPLLLFFAKFYGLKYVGVPWIIINFFALIYLTYICFTKYIQISALTFLAKNVVPNILVSLIVGLVGFGLYKLTSYHFIVFLIISIILSYIIIFILNNFVEKRSILDYHHLFDFPRG